MFFMLQVSVLSSGLDISLQISGLALNLYACADECVLDIRSECTEFPRTRRPTYDVNPPNRPGSFELLEIDANTTLRNVPISQSVSYYGGQSAGNRSTGSGSNLPNMVALAPWPT